jgi:hypothetical protein
MAYILGADIGEIRAPEDIERQKKKWREYLEYLEFVRARMPRSAYEFATAPWHYDTADPRSLHDSWVDSLVIQEPAKGNRHEIRSLQIEVRLVGPYHDGNTILTYGNVHAYSLETPFGFISPPSDVGHGDWVRDEVRLSSRDHVVHEVEFSRGSRWVIEWRAIQWTWVPFVSLGAAPRASDDN